VSIVSVASEQAYGTCASCGAALVSDQRYCLECGAPCSPVRLAFLDVLQSGQDSSAVPANPWTQASVMSGAGVLPLADPFAQSGVSGWLRRNSGLLSLLSVLALCLIAGLLIGHWASNGAPSKQVVELKGFPTTLGVASTTPTSTTPTTSAKGSAAKTKQSESEGSESEAKETAAEKAPPAEAKKPNLKKLSSTTGKKHNEEIEALGTAPIETGH
jgi:hypothetical protein